MEEARCKSKKKMGLLPEVEEEEGHYGPKKVDEDADLEIEEKTINDLTEMERKPIEVKWEPS